MHTSLFFCVFDSNQMALEGTKGMYLIKIRFRREIIIMQRITYIPIVVLGGAAPEVRVFALAAVQTGGEGVLAQIVPVHCSHVPGGLRAAVGQRTPSLLRALPHQPPH